MGRNKTIFLKYSIQTFIEIVNKILSVWIYLSLLHLKQCGSSQLNTQPIYTRIYRTRVQLSYGIVHPVPSSEYTHTGPPTAACSEDWKKLAWAHFNFTSEIKSARVSLLSQKLVSGYFYVSGCCVHMYSCAPYVHRGQNKGEASRTLKLWQFQVPMWCWESISVLLQE